LRFRERSTQMFLSWTQVGVQICALSALRRTRRVTRQSCIVQQILNNNEQIGQMPDIFLQESQQQVDVFFVGL